MKRKKIISMILCGIIMSTSLLPTTVNAYTHNTKIESNQTSINIDEIKKILTEQGINEKTQEDLINKKINGELWDAENPEKLKQVPDEFYILDFNKHFEKKVHIFEDGSILELSHSPKFPNARKIISNPYTTVWEEEAIKATYGVMRATIYVNCEWTKSVGAKIRPFTDSNIYVWNVGGSVSTTEMKVTGSRSAAGKISVYNSYQWGKHADFRAEFNVLGAHQTVSFKLVKM